MMTMPGLLKRRLLDMDMDEDGTSSACLGEGMDVLGRDHHEWRCGYQTVDDLWVLNRLVQPGCRSGCSENGDQTTGGDEGGRSKQAEREMWIRLGGPRAPAHRHPSHPRHHRRSAHRHRHASYPRGGFAGRCQTLIVQGFSKLDRDCSTKVSAPTNRRSPCWWWRPTR